jgi:hypothetical protein
VLPDGPEGHVHVQPPGLREVRAARQRGQLVGRYFSGNGERLNTAIIDDDRARELLG